MALIIKREPRELCPEGIHLTKVKDVEQRRHEEFGQQARFTFEVIGLAQENGSPMLVFLNCSFIFSPSAKLTKTVESILGRKLTDLELSEGFDLESLIGTVAQVGVKHRSSAAGNLYSYVDAVYHVKEDSSPDLV